MNIQNILISYHKKTIVPDSLRLAVYMQELELVFGQTQGRTDRRTYKRTAAQGQTDVEVEIVI